MSRVRQTQICTTKGLISVDRGIKGHSTTENTPFIFKSRMQRIVPLLVTIANPNPPEYTRTVWTASTEGCCLQRVLRFRVPSTTIFGSGPPTTMVTQTHRVYRETERYGARPCFFAHQWIMDTCIVLVRGLDVTCNVA
jgi:hypothetical protein